jgi:hypothetical protein
MRAEHRYALCIRPATFYLTSKKSMKNKTIKLNSNGAEHQLRAMHPTSNVLSNLSNSV